MAVYVLGNSGTPFGRAFFNAALDDLIKRFGDGQPQKVLLYLTDGATIDICEIEELSDNYLVVRGYRAVGGEACELAVQVVPYGLIYRIEISPKAAGGDDRRVGFTPRTVRAETRPRRRS
jgi:hypothetical protein